MVMTIKDRRALKNCVAAAAANLFCHLFFKLLSAIVGFSITSPPGEICKKLLLVDYWCDYVWWTNSFFCLQRFANIGDKSFFSVHPPPPSFVFSCSVASVISLGGIFSHAWRKFFTRWNLFHRYFVENVNVSFYCAGLRSNGGQVLTFYTFWRKNQITINLCI